MAFVRVKGPDGAEFTVDEVAAKSMGSDVSVLSSKDAVDASGRPLPPKYPTTLDGKPKAATEKKEA